MTGYGDAERETPAGRLRLEVKTVNHRFFNASVKTPPGFDRHEQVVVVALKQRIARGHVSAYLSWRRSEPGPDDAPRVDLERARALRAALEAVRAELALPGDVDLAMLSRFGDIFREPDRDDAGEVDPELLRALTLEAADGVVALREDEGLRLREDMEGRLAAVERELETVTARAPERLVAERDRLRESVRELSGQVEVDEDRLAREIAYLADRWDINEELVRLRSHLALFREALDTQAAEAVGKRLGFLVQEMQREANTIGSKANDPLIAHAAVAIKEEVERLREQVENVE